MNNDVRIVLVGTAKVAHDQMLADVRADGKTTINSSKLINWIVADYFERYFRGRKKKLCREHFNGRKGFLEAMKIENPEERRRALQAVAKHLTPVNSVRNKRKFKASGPDKSDAPETK